MKIVVCTLSINDWYTDIVKYSLKNIKTYSELHKYDYVINHGEDIFDKKRKEPWYKIKLIQHIFNTKEFDYLLWIDADCQIMKHDVKLEYFIDKYFNNDNIDLVLTQDTNILNTGVMFFKNTEFNRNLLDEIWNFETDDYFKDFHEQTALAEIFQTDMEARNKITIIPYGKKDELVVYWGNYFPNKSFLVHSARCSSDPLAFMYMMDLFYIFKLQEETYEDYKERLEWLMNPDLCLDSINDFLNDKVVERKYSERCNKNFKLKKLK